MGDDIVHIVQKLHVGGIETLVLDLLRSGAPGDRVLSLEGETGELIANWPALRPYSARIRGMEKKPGIDPGLAVRLMRELASLRPSAVIAHSIGPLLYGGSAARLARAGTLHHFEHDGWHYEQNASHVRLLRQCEWLLRPHHLAVSAEVEAKLRALLPASSITVAAPGIDMDRFQPGGKSAARAALGLDGTSVIVGTVGRLAAIKGHAFLVEAAAMLPAHAEIVIVGDGSERPALEAKAAALGISARIHFLGQRDHIELVLPAFDVFCLPSLGEGLPRAVLEAQACGLPVVASDVGDLRKAVCPQTGYLVAPSDARALAAALRLAMAAPSPDPRARAYVAGRFSLDKLRSTLTAALKRP